MRVRRLGGRGVVALAAAGTLCLGGVLGLPVPAGARGLQSITLDGKAISVSLTKAGQNASITFSGTTGRRVSVVVSKSTVGKKCPALAVSLVRPNKSTLGTPVKTCTANAFLDAQTLDKTGTWSILLDPQGTDVGKLTLQAYAVTDQTTVSARNGLPLPATVTVPGQNSGFTFSSVTGQKVSASLTGSTFGSACGAAKIYLVRPNGTTFGASSSSCGATAYLDSQTLDADGTWTLLVDPQGPVTGTANLTLYNTNDAVGHALLDGSTLDFSTTNPGENASIHFVGDAQQQVSVVITNATFAGSPAFVLSLQRPDGTSFGTSVNSSNASAFLDTQTLDQSGIWSVVVDPQGMTTGSATVQAYDAGDDTGTADTTGKAEFPDFKVPGQNARWTFAGTSGQHVSTYVTEAALSPCGFDLSLVRPDGTTLGGPVSSCTDTAFIEPQTLDQTGEWTVVIDPHGVGTGSATLQVFDVVDTVMKFKPGPSLKTFTSETAGANARYQFNGKVGDTRTVAISASTYPGCPALVVSLVRPDGSVLDSKSTCTSSLTLSAVTLDAAGTWTVLVDPQGPAMGTLIIRLT